MPEVTSSVNALPFMKTDAPRSIQIGAIYFFCWGLLLGGLGLAANRPGAIWVTFIFWGCVWTVFSRLVYRGGAKSRWLVSSAILAGALVALGVAGSGVSPSWQICTITLAVVGLPVLYFLFNRQSRAFYEAKSEHDSDQRVQSRIATGKLSPEARQRIVAQHRDFLRSHPDWLAILHDCVWLGGTTPMPPPGEGTRCRIDFYEDGKVLAAAAGTNRVIAKANLKEVTNIALEGRGLVTRGGGFIGGGFGAKGAIEGIGESALLNSLTTSTSVESIVILQSTNQEWILQCLTETPAELRVSLSKVFTYLRQVRS